MDIAKKYLLKNYLSNKSIGYIYAKPVIDYYVEQKNYTEAQIIASTYKDESYTEKGEANLFYLIEKMLDNSASNEALEVYHDLQETRIKDRALKILSQNAKNTVLLINPEYFQELVKSHSWSGFDPSLETNTLCFMYLIGECRSSLSVYSTVMKTYDFKDMDHDLATMARIYASLNMMDKAKEIHSRISKDTEEIEQRYAIELGQFERVLRIGETWKNIFGNKFEEPLPKEEHNRRLDEIMNKIKPEHKLEFLSRIRFVSRNENIIFRSEIDEFANGYIEKLIKSKNLHIAYNVYLDTLNKFGHHHYVWELFETQKLKITYSSTYGYLLDAILLSENVDDKKIISLIEKLPDDYNNNSTLTSVIRFVQKLFDNNKGYLANDLVESLEIATSQEEYGSSEMIPIYFEVYGAKHTVKSIIKNIKKTDNEYLFINALTKIARRLKD